MPGTNLAGAKTKDTYQRVLTIDQNGNVGDGEGNSISNLNLGDYIPNEINLPNNYTLTTFEDIDTGDVTIHSWNVPNDEYITMIELTVLGSRNPVSNDAGKSIIEKWTFVVGRLAGNNTVIDSFKEYERDTTSLGGTNNKALNTIRLVRTGSESSSSTQGVAILARAGTGAGSNGKIYAKLSCHGNDDIFS